MTPLKQKGSRRELLCKYSWGNEYPEEQIPKPLFLSSCYINDDIRIFLSSIGSTILAFYVLSCEYSEGYVVKHSSYWEQNAPLRQRAETL